MRKFWTFVATALVAGSAFAQIEGDPNGPKIEFKQVGTVYEGITSPDQIRSSGMKIQPNEGGFGIEHFWWNKYGIGAFSPNGDNVSQSNSTDGSKYRASGNTIQIANVDLPHGAVIDAISVWGSDSNPAATVTFELKSNRVASPFTSETIVNYVSADGGDFSSYVAAPPNTYADTYNKQYFLYVNNNGTTSATKFRSVLVWYHRRISPAPVTNSFTDVPTTHGSFQFIEALADSGISLGCGDGTAFCPNSPVTRAQMATFLARALGLNWPWYVSP